MVAANIKKLRQKGVTFLYHFTDEANIESIRKNGLMSASNLINSAITSKMNSDVTSRSIDASVNLENLVRLSFCADNPMMHVALADLYQRC